MLLVMIRLKEVDPILVSYVLKNQVSCMKDTLHSSREHELLLRLFLSTLSPSEVIATIHSAPKTVVISTIRNLCHIPVSNLLSDYVRIENGILSVSSIDVLETVIELLLSMSTKTTHYQRILMIAQLMQRLGQSEVGSSLVLDAITSLLQNTYYILKSSEIALLIRYCNSDHQSSAYQVFYNSVLGCIDDVKRVAEECIDIEIAKLRWIGLTVLDPSCSCLFNKQSTTT